MSANGRLPGSELAPIGGGYYLRKDAAAAFNAMSAESVRRYGTRITIVSAYRDYNKQVYLWNLYLSGRGNLAAHPGSCLEAGAAILTDRGLLPIEQVVLDDMVMTHRGRWRAVTDVRRFENRPTLKVSCSGHPGIYATPEHRWFAFQGWTRPKGIAHAGRELRTVESAALHGDLLASPFEFPPVATPDDYELTPEFLGFCGRYVADGSFHNRHRGGAGDEGIIYARAAKAPAVMALANSSGVPLSRWAGVADEGVVRLRFNGELARWMAEHFGSKSTQRTIPAWLFALPAEQRRMFLDGYLAGDGCWNRGARGRTPHWSWSTSSRCLAVGVVLLAQSLGLHAGLTGRHWAKESIIKGRRCRPTAETWNVAVYPTLPTTGVRRWLHEGFVVSRARVSEAETRTVYDLTVDEDESFIADGLVSHNSNHGWGLAIDLSNRYMRSIVDAIGVPFGFSKSWSDAQTEFWHIVYQSGHYHGAPVSKWATIRRGARGGAVYRAQTYLKYKGFFHWRRSTNFGPFTQLAVKRFQKSRRLPADGVVGPKTWAALRARHH